MTKHTWTSAVFPGTRRDYWVYLPAQYGPDVPAAVMVFQDGGRFVAEDGRTAAGADGTSSAERIAGGRP